MWWSRRAKLAASCLLVQSDVIPSIEDNPIKCPEKWFNASLMDGANVTNAVKQTDEWLKNIDKSRLLSTFKTWLYQQGLLARLLRLYTVYEFPVTAVEGMKRETNMHLPLYASCSSEGLCMQAALQRASVFKLVNSSSTQ